MRANGQVLRHWAEGVSTDWEQIRSWAKRILTRKRVADIALLSTTVAILAVILFSLYKAIQNHTITGISPYLSYANWQPSVPGY